MRRTGVLGGTFDPIHLGHLSLARAARDCVPLDRVLLIPARQSPHKRAEPAASPDDRLAMCRLAAAAEPWLEVSDMEIQREGASYTADTLAELHTALPEEELFLILGWDAARDLRAWDRPDLVMALARIVLVPRPGLPLPTADDLHVLGLEEPGAVVCPLTTPPVAGRDLRAHLSQGHPIDHLVPPEVARYITAHHLYARRN